MLPQALYRNFGVCFLASECPSWFCFLNFVHPFYALLLSEEILQVFSWQISAPTPKIRQMSECVGGTALSSNQKTQKLTKVGKLVATWLVAFWIEIQMKQRLQSWIVNTGPKKENELEKFSPHSPTDTTNFSNNTSIPPCFDAFCTCAFKAGPKCKCELIKSTSK